MTTLRVQKVPIENRAASVESFLSKHQQEELTIYYLRRFFDQEDGHCIGAELHEHIFHADEEKPAMDSIPPNVLALTTDYPDQVLTQIAADCFGDKQVFMNITQMRWKNLPEDEIAPYNVYQTE